MSELEAYERALGRAVAQLADDAEVPRDLIGFPAWLMPDPNPFPVFRLWRWWPAGAVRREGE